VQVGKERYFYAPVELDRRPVGGALSLLHIFYPERSWSDARQQAVYPPLAIGAAALVVAVVVAVLVAARVTRPIDQLQRQVARIAEGNFQPLPVPKRNDEIRDLAEAINRMAQMLARYEDQVRRAERLRTLGQLGGGIAHQMRNCATGCRMALDLHRRDCPSGVDFESLDVATRQLALMEKYLQRFLTLGRPSFKGHAAVDLSNLVESVLPLVRPSAQHVGVELQFAPPAKAIVVQGDAEGLEQLLVNLLLNGVEAAASVVVGSGPPRSERPMVEVRLAREGQRVQLEVRDSGAGPDTTVAADLFEPLVTEKPDGTGLGLSVAREIARQHGGVLRWERRNAMTCFVLEMPGVE
jgi:signal transduction histidine kinase